MSHDFAMLCTIAQNVVTRRLDKRRAGELNTLLRKCREINTHRVRIAHGMWSMGPVRHVSRQSLEAKRYYHDAGEIADLADTAKDYGMRLFRFSAENMPQSK
jgi:hypothetical protein